nr:DNA packaging terminase subunit 1 [Macronycteris gammaherpesvirus 1]
MILTGLKKTLMENYKKTQESDTNEKLCWENDRPAIVTQSGKSERMAHPYIGIISRTNMYSSILDSYCRAANLVYKDNLVPTIGPVRNIGSKLPIITEELSKEVKNLCSTLSSPNPEALIEFRSAVLSQTASRGCPIFQELNQFILNLSSFLNGCYSVKSHNIEPFQKQLILHTFYFLISIKAPETSNKLFETFKIYFDLFDMNQEALQTFKQKSSVYLIPRRHGKTWIVVAIISILLSTVENIHIGYVAHQKHVANSVFTEIVNTLYRWFPPKNIYMKKEDGTVIFTSDGRRPSTLMCATCFNKNVSFFSIFHLEKSFFSVFGTHIKCTLKKMLIALALSTRLRKLSTSHHFYLVHEYILIVDGVLVVVKILDGSLVYDKQEQKAN